MGAFFEHSLALCFFHGMVLIGGLFHQHTRKYLISFHVLQFWDLYKCFANAKYLDINCYQSSILTNIWVLL